MPTIPGGLADISTERKIIPDGSYPATISKFEFKKAGTGAQMFEGNYTIREGEFAKQTIFENIVIINKDGQRNEPGLRRLKLMIEQLFDKDTANDENFDTDNLVGMDCDIVVTTKQGKDENGEPRPENRVKRFIPA